MFLESVVEVLGGGVAKFEGDLGGGLGGIEEVAAGEVEALGGEVAEDGRLECLLEAAFELVFVETDGFCDLGQAWRAVDTGVDEVPGGEDLFLIGGGFEESGLCLA